MRGGGIASRQSSLADVCWSFVGTFIGMASLALINIELWGRQEQGLLLGSFGASAMLVFGAPHAPFAQPRNVVGGQMASALIGVLVQQYAGTDPWLAASLAVALAVAIMHVTGTLHPPGGATALLAVIGSPELKSFGLEFVLYPVGISVVVLTLVGVLYNNLCGRRRYPQYWR
jgi:CBS-domain-containing membrane protein